MFLGVGWKRTPGSGPVSVRSTMKTPSRLGRKSSRTCDQARLMTETQILTSITAGVHHHIAHGWSTCCACVRDRHVVVAVCTIWYVETKAEEQPWVWRMQSCSWGVCVATQGF